MEAIIRQLRQVAARQEQQLATLQSQIAELQKRPRSITEEIDAIPGRRIVYTLSGEQSFTSSQDGVRGNPVSMLVSQDGPFVMTHYPLIMWYPNAPSTATNFGRWRPISSWPLPNQQNATAATNADSTVLDVIDISFEIVDGGSQRNFQNLTVAPGLLSRPDNLVPLPVPTLFAPNTTVQVIVTYNNILFSSANTPPTGGNLHIDLPGYRIVNL